MRMIERDQPWRGLSFLFFFSFAVGYFFCLYCFLGDLLGELEI